jgi:hypothetical protein
VNWAAFEAISVAASAIVASGAFVISLIASSKRRRQTEVQAWQRTVIHSVLHRHGDTELSFDQIKNEYRSEATAYGDHALTSEDLSDSRLRQILMWMIGERILDQNIGDHYVLQLSEPHSPKKLVAALVSGITPLAQEQSQKAVDDAKVVDGVYSFVFENNFKLPIAEIALQLAGPLGADAGRIRTILVRLVIHRVLIVDESNCVGAPLVSRKLLKSASQ